MKLQLTERQHQEIIEYVQERARGLARTPTNTLAWLIMDTEDFKAWKGGRDLTSARKPAKRKAKA